MKVCPACMQSNPDDAADPNDDGRPEAPDHGVLDRAWRHVGRCIEPCHLECRGCRECIGEQATETDRTGGRPGDQDFDADQKPEGILPPHSESFPQEESDDEDDTDQQAGLDRVLD